jgi:dienelactone hydrolase
MRGRIRVVAALLIAAACGSAGCSQQHSGHAVISVDAPTALADRSVQLKISELAPRDKVTVSATALDYLHTQWRSQAAFRADSRGVVDLGHARPLSGTYSDVDGMGLLWSMNPPADNAQQAGFVPIFPENQPAYDVQITVTAHGHRLAGQTLTRQWLASGVSHKTLTIATDKVAGELFLPPPGTPRHPAVLLLGGSEGGNSGVFEASLLASHGYPALSVAYFREPGLPSTLQNIPLEYFTRAAGSLAAQPDVDPAHLVVQGSSRGSEAALLLAQHYPDLIHGVIVYSPSDRTNLGFPNGGTAWTDHGHPIDLGTIPLDHVNGPLLAIAGAQDKLWGSVLAVQEIMGQLDLDHDHFVHQSLIYQGAGHGVGTFPYLSGSTQSRSPVTGQLLTLGGSRAGNAAAKEQGWLKALAFLADLDQ